MKQILMDILKECPHIKVQEQANTLILISDKNVMRVTSYANDDLYRMMVEMLLKDQIQKHF